jgi:outer membrane protein assembly factor BamB
MRHIVTLVGMLLSSAAAAATGSIAWRFETLSNYISHRAAVGSDGTVYVNDSNGVLYAISEDGDLLWRYEADGSGSQGPTVIGRDGTIYFGTASDTAIHALDPDGTVNWIYDVPDSQGPIGGPAVGPDGNVYAVFDLPGDVGAISLTPDGDLRWNNEGDPRIIEYGQLGRELVFTAGRVYWTSEYNSALYGFDTATGDQEVLVDVTSPGQADAGRRMVYVPTGVAPRLHAYDADGDLEWAFFGDETTVTNVLSAPDLAGASIYINRNLGELYAVGPTPDTRWSSDSLLEQGPLGGPIASPTNRIVLIGGQSTYGRPGLVRGFFARSGAPAFTIRIPEEADGTCAVPYARAIFTPDGTRAYIPAAQLCEAPVEYHSWLYAIDITE